MLFPSISIPRNLVDVSGQLFPILVKDTLLMDIFLPEISQCLCRGFIISRGAEGPGREILQRPPSVCLSVCPSRLVFAL